METSRLQTKLQAHTQANSIWKPKNPKGYLRPESNGQGFDGGFGGSDDPILPVPSEMLPEEGFALREWRRGRLRVLIWAETMAAPKPEEISHPAMDQLQGLEGNNSFGFPALHFGLGNRCDDPHIPCSFDGW
ncbi:hypothetical protein TB1_029655 [Malus domestica]